MRALLLSLSLIACAQAAPSISLNGAMGKTSALLVIDGRMAAMQVGQTVQGVKLISVSEGEALVEIEGRRLQLVLGAAPASLSGASSGSQRIVLNAGQGGHFMAQGSINGQSVSFMVDTGATTVAIGIDDANRLGLRYHSAPRMLAHTANGTVAAYRMTLDRVRVGDVELNGVEAAVVGVPMGNVLLGNSFLSRFQMRRENDVMTLERRY